MVWLFIIRRNRTEWSLSGPVILWTIKQNRRPTDDNLLNPLKSITTDCQLGGMFYYRFPCLTLNPVKSVCAMVRTVKVPRRDGNENVAWKVNLCSFTLYRNFSYPLTLSNVGEPNWSWIPIDISKFQKRNKISSLLVTLTSPKNANLGIFKSQSCKNGKEMYKNVWGMYKVVVLLIIKLLLFWRSRWRRVVGSLSS